MEKIGELERLSDDELKGKYDEIAQGNFHPETALYLQILAWRRQDRQTGRIALMTVVMTVATIINVVIAFCRH